MASLTPDDIAGKAVCGHYNVLGSGSPLWLIEMGVLSSWPLYDVHKP